MMPDQPTAPADPTSTADPSTPAPDSTDAPATPAPDAPDTTPSAPAVDPRDQEIADLKAQLAAQASSTEPAAAPEAPPTTVAASPAEANDDYKPVVGHVVDYEVKDPQTEQLISGIGLVVEVQDSHAIVAQLPVLGLPVTTLRDRSGG